MATPPTDLEINVQKTVADISGNRASAVRVREDVVSLVLNVAGMEASSRGRMEAALKQDLSRIGGIGDVRIVMTAEKTHRRIIAVGSGKGGVGKSTFAANLAVAMQRMGRKVGLVDADIYGPSQPRLLSCEGVKPEIQDKKLVPVPNAYHVPVLSMGHLAKPGQAIAWRGPMASSALTQLFEAAWGDITDIVVDLPPGTGDVQMSVMQKFKPDGAVIVSTPQDLALMDAARAISLFDQGKVPIIGLAENMAGYICPHCNQVSDPFGSGGAQAAAAQMDLPFLGRIALDIAIRKASDAGTPLAAGKGPQSDAFAAIAKRVLAWIDTRQAA